MSKFKDFCDKVFFGGFYKKLPFKKETYILFPKTAFFMVPGIVLAGLFQADSLKDVPALFWTGIGLILVGLYSFYYPMFRNKIK